MLTRAAAIAASAAFVGLAKAQANEYWFIPDDLVGQFCDGSTVPDWDACEDAYVDWFNGRDMHIGPGFLEGQTLTVGDCQLRYVKCKDGDYEWTQEEEMGLFSILRRTCEPLGGGGVRRQGDLCVIAENPVKPFAGKEKRSVDGLAERPAAQVKREPVSEPELVREHPKDMLVARDLVAESRDLERRQSCSGDGTCYGYTQYTFAGNIRGTRVDICQVPDGASCSEAVTTTVTSSYTVSFEATTGLKDVIDVTAGFQMTNEESESRQLRYDIPVDCPSGRGRVVWYPLMEVSVGECTVGTCSGGYCSEDTRSDCTTRKPIPESSSFLSGEYDVICN